MNLIFTSIISLLVASVAQADKFAINRNSSVSYGSNDCPSSNSSCSFDGEISQVCQDELADIEAQANPAAVAFFRSLQVDIMTHINLWLNSSTQTDTALAFCAANGIIVRVYGAMGLGKEFPSTNTVGGPIGITHMRAEALNKGVYAKGMPGDSNDRYSFQYFTSTGSYAMFELIAPRNKLPLGNMINIKRNALRKCN